VAAADTSRLDRRLAAIMAADVVGYSRLDERDEAGTIARLKALRRETLEPILARHGGRIAKLTGDGAIVEFSSAGAAVQAAIECQRAVAAHEAVRPATERITFRIGLNLGDIQIEPNGDVLGDGVNVAARLSSSGQSSSRRTSRMSFTASPRSSRFSAAPNSPWKWPSARRA
jgi:class 3 adenylate cyclase